MINQREISKWQFIFQFWKKVLTILLCTSVLWGVLRVLCIYFDLFPAIDDNIIAIGIPCVLACCMPCLIDKDTEPYLVFKITTFKHKTTESWDRLNGAIIMLICTIVLFNTNTLVEYSMREIASVPTISQNNLSECLKADYIHVDQLAVHKEDVGRLDQSYSYTEKSKKHVATKVFDVAPLLYLPNVYVCKCREGNDITPLIGVKFADLYLNRVTSAADLKHYRTAASFCITPLPEGTEIKDIIFLEVSSEFDATLGNHAWLYILGALLGGTLIWMIFFALVSKGPFYPLTSHPFFKKSHKAKKNILWLSIQRAFAPHILFVWYIPVISIIVFIAEVNIGLSTKGSNSDILYKVGAATPNSISNLGEYWRLFSCTFVHAGFIDLLLDSFFYLLLAYLCSLFSGWGQSKIHSLLLFVFYWTGNLASNFLFVSTGAFWTGGLNGITTLVGIMIVFFLSNLICSIQEKEHSLGIYVIFAICIGGPIFNMLYCGLSPFLALPGIVCGFIFQLLVILHYWITSKNEDKEQNYQKEYK